MSGEPTAGTRGRGDPERGSATVIGAGAIVAVLVALMAAVQLGAAAATRQRTQSAADLAALAAAAQLVAGADVACGSAKRVAERMAGRLASCEIGGWTVTVRVHADVPGLIGRFGPARATARAGPVE